MFENTDRQMEGLYTEGHQTTHFFGILIAPL